ncbi:PilN domain-containing protein [Psychrobacter sp. FDAARGOS_221]|uniref:PilN domain-containing protein n=1 Tax=Psychrobacter sp. FDAARGOS_221 TaxID=1975705 RepID=UPI000BB56DE9|nr:PilN domain-containing protein [Psychrobacter sp. FDAARGOS_221]PNK60360.1 hypothetical protein A6J60_005385 [Psychrobacter sp. FDAARGOS_221]
MAQINLLPWREQLRQDKNKQFKKGLSLSVVMSLGFAVLAWGFLHYQQSRQLAATAYLNDAIDQLDQVISAIEDNKMQQQTIAVKQTAIEALNYERTLLPRIWADVASTLSNRLYVTAIKYEAGVVTINGSATHATEVTKWAQKLSDSAWLQQAQIQYVKQGTLPSSNQGSNPSQQSIQNLQIQHQQSTQAQKSINNYPYNFVISAVVIEVGQVAALLKQQAAAARSIQPLTDSNQPVIAYTESAHVQSAEPMLPKPVVSERGSP